MHFTFNIRMTDDDYLKFNQFHMLRSPYGKKQLLTFRVLAAIMVLLVSACVLIANNFASEALFTVILFLIFLLIIELCAPKMLASSLKHQIKALKKNGKPGYSPSSVIEFFDDSFTESTDTAKAELKYSSIERVSVIGHDAIYLHVNNIMAYILPANTFASNEEYNNFLNFIKTKCNTIDYYTERKHKNEFLQ